MADFEIQKSFNIDNGELDGFSSQQCFVLGYELAQIDSLLNRPFAFSKPVHAANKERIESACVDSKREFKLTWMSGDSSETWMFLNVGPIEDGE